MPITVAAWVRPNALGVDRNFWSLCDTATATNYFSLGQAVADTWRLRQTDDATPISLAIGTVTANQWAFVVARFVSATIRRMSVLQYGGSIAQGLSTTSDTPAGLDTMAIGALYHSAPTEYWGGDIAELWYTNTDIQPDGLQLQNNTLRQLAYGGPFSVPHIADKIIEYRSFESGLGSDRDRPDEVYLGAGKTRPVWTNTNGVTLGAHVPLPGYYEGPTDARRVGIV